MAHGCGVSIQEHTVLTKLSAFAANDDSKGGHVVVVVVVRFFKLPSYSCLLL